MTPSEITINISATLGAMVIMMKRADKMGMTGEEFVRALKGRESEFAKLVESCKNYLEAK